MSKQRMQIIGNLGRDPEMRYTPNGTPVTRFSVATTRQWTDRNTKKRKKDTTWFSVDAWGLLGENCNQYLKKGSKVEVEGRMKKDPATGGPRIWIDGKGDVRASFEITAESVLFLDSAPRDSVESDDQAGVPEPEDDEYPF